MGQVLCVPMVLAGIALMVEPTAATRRSRRRPEPLFVPGRITSQASSAPGSRLSAPGVHGLRRCAELAMQAPVAVDLAILPSSLGGSRYVGAAPDIDPSLR